MNLSDRQQSCLLEIAQTVSSTTSEQGVALFFLEDSADQANELLKVYSCQGTSLLQYSVMLRLIHHGLQNPNILQEQTRKHLENELANAIRSGKEKLFLSNTEFGESQEILSLSCLFLWSIYVEQTKLNFTWPDKLSNQQHLQQTLHEIQIWLDQRARYGYSERSSPLYTFTLAALMNIRDYCEDSTMRIKSDALIDILLADIAQESLEYFWGGARSRSFEAVSPLPGSRLYHILFGTARHEEQSAQLDWLTFHLCQTGYIPPPALVKLAANRRQRGTYEVKNLFAKDIHSLETTQKKYAYVSPNFIMGSFRLFNEHVPMQSRPWDLLVWDVENGENHLFSFAGDQLFSGGRDPAGESFLWNSTCVQYKNILFCQFQKSDRKRSGSFGPRSKVDERYILPSTRVWIPNTYSPVTEEGGWWFCEVGEVFIAFRPLSGHAYWWRTAETTGISTPGATILNFQDLNAGFLIEVEESSRFSSFDEFKNQLIASPLEVEEDFVTFVSRRGDVLLFPRKDGPFLVNGKEVDTAERAYDLFQSPYSKSQYGSAKYFFEMKPYSLSIDLSDPLNPQRIQLP